MFQHPSCRCNLAVRSLDVFFFSETRVESQPKFHAARAHLPCDVAKVPVHPAFCEFKQRFMNFCAHFGYTRTHPFPADGDAVGDSAPPDAPAKGGGPCPPPPPTLYPVVLRPSLHHGTLWVLFWMLMMPLALMHHHPMYRA